MVSSDINATLEIDVVVDVVGEGNFVQLQHSADGDGSLVAAARHDLVYRTPRALSSHALFFSLYLFFLPISKNHFRTVYQSS